MEDSRDGQLQLISVQIIFDENNIYNLKLKINTIFRQKSI